MLDLSIAISLAYVFAALLCGRAFMAAAPDGNGRAERSIWLLCALAFLTMTAIRMFDGEDRAREALRSAIRESGEYATRTALQGPLVAALILGVAAAIIGIWWLRSRSLLANLSWPAFVAIVASAAFIPLYAMRIISLHSLDALLYSGPIRLNWVLDGSLTLTVCASAALAPHFSKKRPGKTSAGRRRRR